MKRILILLIAISTVAMVKGQKRIVLVESFTNTGCGPSAGWAPILDSAIKKRLGDCIAIKYHTNYPSSDDEFYDYNQDAQQARQDFYQINGTPTTFVDGQELFNRSFNFINTAINWCQQQNPVNYSLSVQKQLNNHRLTADVYLTPHQNTPSENIRLFVAVIQEHIEVTTPYPNGETEQNYTFRKMITPNMGYQFDEYLTIGNTYEYTGSWDIDVTNNNGRYGVVAFLQDITSREILVTAYSGPYAEEENHLSLIDVCDTPDEICQPEFFGKVIILNEGGNVITNAILNVNINGSLIQYPWIGQLDHFERDTVSFSDFCNFELNEEGQNEVYVWLSEINGNAYTSNTYSLQFENAVQATYGVRLQIYTDKKPEETTWRLYNSQGHVVRQGGPYHEARKYVNEDFDLRSDDCYQLKFLDSGGDGIKGANGNGFYKLIQIDADGNTTELTKGDYSGATHLVNFGLHNAPFGEKCSTPTITFENGEISFNCETEDVEFYYNVKCDGDNTSSGNHFRLSNLKSCYHITVYATKAGWISSDPATLDIEIPGLLGDANGDGEITIADAVKIVDVILGDGDNSNSRIKQNK
ncbi:MAG: hypothetical protein K6A96_04400 [Prevotella sp.]|nr:hypothetical protein [Prevotella sp.]